MNKVECKKLNPWERQRLSQDTSSHCLAEILCDEAWYLVPLGNYVAFML
jgi:hypothetical protein